MDYNTLVSYLASLLQYDVGDTNFQTILPAAIQDAEQRIYLAMDFLNTRTVNSGSAFTPGSRTFTLPTSPSTIMVLQGVAAITPALTAPSAGKRNQLEPVSLDYIDSTWPTESQTGVPDAWAMLNDASIVVKPTPAAAYTVELTGTFRPTPMGPSNLTTYIGNTYPQLLVAACMIFLAGYQRDFGAQSDDPKLALSWKTTFGEELQLALSEEQRRKGQGTGWTPFSSTPEAAPPRT
jgi:hypothetical protein